MDNFIFQNPVKIIFGEGMIAKIKSEISSESKILMLYGGGSIKQNGVYTQVADALSGFEWEEFGGIEPNPHYETCMKAVELIRAKNIDFLLAVGGGSVVDAVKFIAAAACFSGGDPWQIVSEGKRIEKAIPFGVVLTLPATGSEMNTNSVITRVSNQSKLAFSSSKVYPRFSVLDPTTTFTLPPRQTANGVIDTFVHVVEQYLTYPSNALLQDMFAESIFKVLITEGPKALELPNDYSVRANLMWASTWGLNGWIACGVPQDWATHSIGHELTAFFGIDHAQTLAIVLPGLLTVLKEQKAEKLIRMGETVFGITSKNSSEIVDKTIDAIEKFFNSMGVKTRLSDYGLGIEAVETIHRRLAERGWSLGEKENITADVTKEILMLRV